MDNLKLPVMPVIAMVMGMAGAIGTAAVSLYQLGEVRTQLAEITNRAEVSEQAIMRADVQRLKTDVEKLLVLSDDNMNKIIAINAKGQPEAYNDSELRLQINGLTSRIEDLHRNEGEIRRDIEDLFMDLDEALGRD